MQKRATMKKNLLCLFIAFLSINFAFALQEIKGTVHFEPGQFQLTNKSLSQLDNILKALKAKEITRIELKGFTDSDGEEVSNDTLSKNRAAAVASYFLANGFDKNKIQVNFFGEQQPVASNTNATGKKVNRRVEIVIEHVISVPKDFVVGYKEFTIRPNADVALKVNAKGTTLHIPKNCFVDKNGKPVQDKVTLRYKEYSNSAEMAFSKVPMTYKQGDEEYFFNSSGMFEINGVVNNEPVNIAKGKNIKIDFALAVKNPDISFFKMNNKGDWKKVQAIKPAIGGRLLISDPIRDDFEGLDHVRNRNRDTIIIDADFQIQDHGNRKAATLLASGADAGHTYPDIIRGLNVDSFGVYNCDQIYRVPNRLNINAKYVDPAGKEIKNLHVLSMIDLRYNGAFSFAPNSFICDAKGENVLALFTNDGELYLLDKTQFAEMNITKSGQYTFRMENKTKEIKNTKDLAN